MNNYSSRLVEIEGVFYPATSQPDKVVRLFCLMTF